MVCALLNRLKVFEILFKHWPAIACLKYLHIRKSEEEETQLKREVSTLHVFGYHLGKLRKGHSWGGFNPGIEILCGCHVQKPLNSTVSFKITALKSPLGIRTSCSTLFVFKLRYPSPGFLFLFGQA